MSTPRERPMEDPYGSRLAHLEGQVGGLTVQVSNLSQGMVEIGHKIDRIVDRIGHKEPVNWGWIVTGVLALGGFILLYTQPLAEENAQQDAQISRLLQKQYEIREEQIREHATIQQDHEAMMKRLEHLETHHE